MADLIATTPCAGLLPVTVGALMLTELDPGPMTSIMPLNGKQAATTKLLKEKLGLALPGAGRTSRKGDAALIWFGRGQVMLMGVEPPKGLAEVAATTDQSDAWAMMRLEGEGAADTLARLTTLDLRDSQFKRGHTARCQINHMMGSVTRIGANGYDLMVFRSMAATAVHELTEAMESLAARKSISAG